MKYTFLLLAIVATISSAFAQNKQSPTDKDYSQKPLWIAMMEDEKANFFEVEKAFNLYFAVHEMPEGEHEQIGEHAERVKHYSNRKLRKIEAANELRFAVKRYKIWHYQTLPYVQADGRILNADERLEIWKSQKSQ